MQVFFHAEKEKTRVTPLGLPLYAFIVLHIGSSLFYWLFKENKVLDWSC